MSEHLSAIFDEISQFDLVEISQFDSGDDFNLILIVRKTGQNGPISTIQIMSTPFTCPKWLFTLTGIKIYKITNCNVGNINNFNIISILDICLNYCKNAIPNKTKTIVINLNQNENYIQIKVAKQHEINDKCFILTDNFDDLHNYLNQPEISKQIYF